MIDHCSSIWDLGFFPLGTKGKKEAFLLVFTLHLYTSVPEHMTYHLEVSAVIQSVSL